MNKSSRLNRRSFLYGKIAFASTIGFGGAAYALGPKQMSNTQSVLETKDQPSWKAGTADQFAKIINQPFTAITNDGDMLHLTLVKAEAGNSGANRPKDLPRSESVSLIFKSDFAEDLADQGHQTVWMWNSTLGESQILLGAVPRRSGGYDIEVVLN